MPELPNYPVTEFEAKVSEYRVKDRIQRDDGSIVYVVADLPTDGSFRMENPDALSYYVFLRCKICIK